MGVGQRRVQAAALPVDRQDAVGGAVQYQSGDVDPLDVAGEVVQPGARAGPRRVRRRVGACVPGRPDGFLADPRAEVVVQVEEVTEQAGPPGEPVVEDGLLHVGDPSRVDPVGVAGPFRERRGEAFDEHQGLERLVP